MLVSNLPLSFLDTYSLSMSSLGHNALCMVISFLVFRSICLSSSQIYFKNDPKYLMRETAEVFIPFIFSLVSCSFLVLRYSFLIFSFSSTCLIVSASNIPKYLYDSFSPSILFFLDLVFPFHSSCVVSRFSLLAWRIFLGQIPSLCPYYFTSRKFFTPVLTGGFSMESEWQQSLLRSPKVF